MNHSAVAFFSLFDKNFVNLPDSDVVPLRKQAFQWTAHGRSQLAKSLGRGGGSNLYIAIPKWKGLSHDRFLTVICSVWFIPKRVATKIGQMLGTYFEQRVRVTHSNSQGLSFTEVLPPLVGRFQTHLQVSRKEKDIFSPAQPNEKLKRQVHVLAVDCGIKNNIIRHISEVWERSKLTTVSQQSKHHPSVNIESWSWQSTSHQFVCCQWAHV